MSIFQYEVFLTVVESGSFTKAGEKLGLTQSGVSHNISTLETELGIVLLLRNRNGIALTDAGERVLPHIRQILHYEKMLEQEAALIQGIEVGSIKIGTFPSFSSRFLPGLIRIFIKKYPGIQIELYEGGYGDIKEWISLGAIDMGFLALPSKEFDTIQLFKGELFVLVHESHRMNTLKRVPVKSIHNEPFIMPKAGCDVLVKRLIRENNVHLNVIFEKEDNNTIISMVQEGLGITIIPEIVLPKNIPNTKVIPIETDLYREIGIAIKSIKLASPSVKKFIEITKEKFKQDQLE
ncbi:LysR family transcriptional regulator [Bacillus sp. JJ1562]